MTTPPPRFPDSEPTGNPPARHRSYLKQIVLTLLCGVLLAGGSCYGFLNTANFNGPNNPTNTVFVIGFFAGCAAVIAGALAAVVAFIVWFIRAVREGP